MAVKQVKFNDTYIYINDEVDDKETGIKISKDNLSEETKIIEKINIQESLDKTSLDIMGDKNE